MESYSSLKGILFESEFLSRSTKIAVTQASTTQEMAIRTNRINEKLCKSFTRIKMIYKSYLPKSIFIFSTFPLASFVLLPKSL